MWTKRMRCITYPEQLADYLSSIGHFHDDLIVSFFYDSKSDSLLLTVKEDCLAENSFKWLGKTIL